MRRFRLFLFVVVVGVLVFILTPKGYNQPPVNLVFYTPAEDASGGDSGFGRPV